MSRKKSAMLGYDPLAWIKQDEESSDSSSDAVEEGVSGEVSIDDKVEGNLVDNVDETSSSVVEVEEKVEKVEKVEEVEDVEDVEEVEEVEVEVVVEVEELMENEIIDQKAESDSIIETSTVSDPIEETVIDNDSKQSEEITIDLAESLDMAVVCDLYAELEPLLSSEYKKIIFNASEVSFIGTSCIQTLAVFLKDAESLGISVSWQGSSGLCETLGLLDATVLLKLPEQCA